MPVPERRAKATARSPLLKPSSEEHSFEDSERSTLPSAQPSARQVRHKGGRSLPQSPVGRWSLAEEVRRLDGLQSNLMQWTFANCLAEQAFRRSTQRLEEEVFDRSLQVCDLLQETLQLKNEAADRPKAKLLKQVLAVEADFLCPLEEDILQTSEYMQELETAALSSLHRLPLEMDEKVLGRALGVAHLSLARIHQHFDEILPDVPGLREAAGGLLELVQEERAEVLEALLHLSKLRSLYEEEKALLFEPADESSASY